MDTLKPSLHSEQHNSLKIFCTEQSISWKVDSYLAREQIPILWNLKVNNHVHKSFPLGHILSQLSTVHTLTPYLFLNFNIILPLMVSLSSGLISLSFPTQILYAFLISLTCATCPTHLIIPDLFSLEIWILFINMLNVPYKINKF